MKKCQPRSLTPFLDGELTEDAWQELDQHLQSCPACSAQLDELTAASQQVRAMGRAQIPKDSLRFALAAIAGRTGLWGEAAMRETKEIAWAKRNLATENAVDVRQGIDLAPGAAAGGTPKISEAHWPADLDTPDQPWAPGEIPIDPLPEMGATQEQLPGIAIPGNLYWNQPRAAKGTRVEPVDTARAGEPDEPALEDEPEPAPTWVEPERWHPEGPAETGASAYTRSPDKTPPVERVAPTEDAEPERVAPTEDAEPERVPPTEDAEPEPGAAGLETHPSPPPAQLVPSWMETQPASDAELEEAGRAAVDEAIGPPAEPDPDTSAGVEVPSMADYVGPTSAVMAELGAALEPDPPGGQDAGDEGKATRRSRFAAILGGRWGGRPSQASEKAAAPGELGAAVGDAKPAVVELTVHAPEANDRPEAERLMWITPRAPGVEPAAEPEPLPEPGAETEPPVAATPDDDASRLRGYREALHWAPDKPVDARTRLLSSPGVRISAGLGAALVVILLAAGILYLYSTRSTHTSTTAVSQPAASHAAAPTSASQPTPSVGPTTAASPATGGVPGPLSGLVTAGSGGTGWTVSRIRLGSPGNGITRVVLDLVGTGPAPTAQLGRGSDGSIYLNVPGLAISPSVVSGLTPTGALTAITQVGGSGTSLRFNTKGSPAFSLGYLTGPNRLVVDFK